MKQIVTHLLAIIIMSLMLSACEINNTPKHFFSTIDEAMRYEPQSPNDSTPYIYCKYQVRDTIFDNNGNPIKEDSKKMNDIVITLGNDTIFLDVPFGIKSATLDFWTTDKLFTKNGSEAKEHWELEFKKFGNKYFITNENFPNVPKKDEYGLDYYLCLRFSPEIKIIANEYNYKSERYNTIYSNEIEYSFDEIELVDRRYLNMKYDKNERYFWSGEENEASKFKNWLQYNSIFEK